MVLMWTYSWSRCSLRSAILLLPFLELLSLNHNRESFLLMYQETFTMFLCTVFWNLFIFAMLLHLLYLKQSWILLLQVKAYFVWTKCNFFQSSSTLISVVIIFSCFCMWYFDIVNSNYLVLSCILSYASIWS